MWRVLFFVGFGAAVLALPEAGSAWKEVVRVGAAAAWMRALGWTAVLAGALFGAGLGMYAVDRRAGRVRRRIALYERILWGAGR